MVFLRYTYEVAPVFTLMEDAVLRKMIKMMGWEEGGDGIFNAGTLTDRYQYFYTSAATTASVLLSANHFIQARK